MQIPQECAKETNEDESLTVSQRTPNLACPMQLEKITKEEDEKLKSDLAGAFKERLTYDAGFMYTARRNLKVFDHSGEREKFFEELWGVLLLVSCKQLLSAPYKPTIYWHP